MALVVCVRILLSVEALWEAETGAVCQCRGEHQDFGGQERGTVAQHSRERPLSGRSWLQHDEGG